MSFDTIEITCFSDNEKVGCFSILNVLTNEELEMLIGNNQTELLTTALIKKSYEKGALTDLFGSIMANNACDYAMAFAQILNMGIKPYYKTLDNKDAFVEALFGVAECLFDSDDVMQKIRGHHIDVLMKLFLEGTEHKDKEKAEAIYNKHNKVLTEFLKTINSSSDTEENVENTEDKNNE